MSESHPFLSFTLPDAFINEYKNREVPWGFPMGGGNSLGELTFLTKYSRRKEDGTKERWYEVCRRVIEGQYSILKDHCKTQRTPWNEFKAQKAAQDAFERMFVFKWLPPGRGLWMMGSEFVHANNNSAALQNCFRGTEEIVTREYGPTPFIDVVGQEITVWTKTGWEKAEVSSFGEQPVQSITFAPAYPTPRGEGYRRMRSNHRLDVVATPDHRWILIDGSETTNLSIGDTVPSSFVAADRNEDYWDGLVHGLIFGDGVKITHRYANGDFGFELRACDARTQNALLDNPEISSRFDKISYERPSANGDPICSKRSPVDMKDFPSGSNIAYNAGFLDGWCMADANYIANGVVKLDTQNVNARAWVEKWAASSGYVLTGVTVNSIMETNYGARRNPLIRFSLNAATETAWKVESISPLDEPEEVFCAVVPNVGEFALASGVYTGNCSFVSTEKLSNHSAREATLPFVRLMEMSMLGVGVGFDTKGAGSLEIHEPSDEVEIYVVPDTREGWCDSTGALLESYFFKNRKRVEFDYSEVRPAGEPIKGFGGTAAGPGPLKRLHELLREQFDGRKGQKITSRDIVDVQNKIGQCVVAGNVRRSAELALGDLDDKDFLNLKNWEQNPERMGANGWGNISNNSLFASVGENYDSIVDLIANNGEPGLFWLDLSRQYGRLVDPPTNRDYRVAGSNPCVEQSLESYEMCTLVESFPYRHESLEDFKATLKHAYLYGKAVTLMTTHWPETNEIMQRNRRIGCSVSGVAQFAEARGWTELRHWLDESYQYVAQRDVKYSEWLGVRESIKMTSVKPSGTVSLLAGVTPGVHWPVADRYIRRMRLSNIDPILPILIEAGYHAEPDVMDSDHTVVVELPVLGPDVRTEREVSMWEKTALAALLQRYWADNQVSVTVTFLPEEADQIGPLLRAHDGQLKSLSMLPLSEGGAYAQMPYERISEEEVLERQASVKKINWNALYDTGNIADAEGERFCSNDVCEIPS